MNSVDLRFPGLGAYAPSLPGRTLLRRFTAHDMIETAWAGGAERTPRETWRVRDRTLRATFVVPISTGIRSGVRWYVDSWPDHLREVLLLLASYLAYMYSRALVFSDYQDTAVENAWRVIRLEHSVGMFWETAWQSWAIENAQGVVVLLNWSYILTFWPVIGGISLFLYVVDRDRYHYYRNIRLVSLALALLLYMLFPLAPPRMIEELFVDTIKIFGPTGYASRDFDNFYNAYAAMPSLHFGWTMMFGAMFLRTSAWWMRAIGVIYPAQMLLAITITGNHYIVDAIGGALVVGVSFLAVRSGFHSRILAAARSRGGNVRDFARFYRREQPGGATDVAPRTRPVRWLKVASACPSFEAAPRSSDRDGEGSVPAVVVRRRDAPMTAVTRLPRVRGHPNGGGVLPGSRLSIDQGGVP